MAMADLPWLVGPETSDSNSDYDPRFHQTQDDVLRLLHRADLQVPDAARLPQTDSLCMACRHPTDALADCRCADLGCGDSPT
jgi:hypothetical protein